MNKQNQGKNVLVIGLGNLFMKDEGFGVHVARRLKQVELPDNVRVLDGGVDGFNLLGELDDIDLLLVVDVMMSKSPPGEVRVLEPGPELAEPGKIIMSFHQVGVLDLLQMWDLIDRKPPEVLFVVTSPQTLEWGMELTPALEAAVDQAVEQVQQICLNFVKRSQGLCTI